jgi:hypothetical protein
VDCVEDNLIHIQQVMGSTPHSTGAVSKMSEVKIEVLTL